jgi:hypothetical protein
VEDEQTFFFSKRPHFWRSSGWARSLWLRLCTALRIDDMMAELLYVSFPLFLFGFSLFSVGEAVCRVRMDWIYRNVYSWRGERFVVKNMLIARKEKFWIESRERGGSAEERARKAEEEKFGLGKSLLSDPDLSVLQRSQDILYRQHITS